MVYYDFMMVYSLFERYIRLRLSVMIILLIPSILIRGGLKENCIGSLQLVKKRIIVHIDKEGRL